MLVKLENFYEEIFYDWMKKKWLKFDSENKNFFFCLSFFIALIMLCLQHQHEKMKIYNEFH